MITITSNSIDELNLVFRRLKKDFKANDTIKLNEHAEYQLVLTKQDLIGNALRQVLDKVLDTAEMMDAEKTIFTDFTKERLFLEASRKDSVFRCLKPLQKVWGEISDDKKLAAFMYLCEKRNIQPEPLEDEETNTSLERN